MATVKSSPLSETPQNRQPLLPSSPTLGGSNGIATKLWKRDTLSYMAFRGHAETHLPEEGRFAKLGFAEIICLITPRLRIQPLHGPFTVELDFMILVEPFQLRIFCDSMIYGAPWRMRWKRCYQTETKAISLWDVSLSSLGSPHFILYPSTSAGPCCVHGCSPKPSGQVMGSYQKEVILLDKIIKKSPVCNVCRRNVMTHNINWESKGFVQIFLFSKYDVVLVCGYQGKHQLLSCEFIRL